MITEATLRLRPTPPVPTTVAATFADVVAAGRAVTTIASSIRPSALELMDAAAIEAVQRVKPMGFEPSVGAVLIAQTDGPASEAELVAAACEGAGAMDVVVSDDEAEGEAGDREPDELLHMGLRVHGYNHEDGNPVSRRGFGVSIEAGTLYVVATPIGNRGDLSDRARAVLGGVTLILAEDTRHTRPLLRELGIATPLFALHEHNERSRVDALVDRLARGDSLALVSDAGTPLVSDPGFLLVRGARAGGHPVRPVPGACAAIAALSVAGLPVDRFAFEGFLPARAVARQKALAALASEPRTLVFYEAVHRVRETLADLARAFGDDREALVARELTKRHETTRSGTLGELAAWAAGDDDVVRGELVLVVAGAAAEVGASRSLDARALLLELARELPAAKAAQITARLTGEPRKLLYQWLIDHQTK